MMGRGRGQPAAGREGIIGTSTCEMGTSTSSYLASVKPGALRQRRSLPPHFF